MSLLSEDLHAALGRLERFVAGLGVMGDPAVPIVAELWAIGSDYEAALAGLADRLVEAARMGEEEEG